ncbi:MAG: glycogen/starch/alpha-glucan phosphorylase [Desulfobacterales bacterium]
MTCICSKKTNLRYLLRHLRAQLNDTHPAVAIAELMRLLVDEHRMDWEMPGTSPATRFRTPITPFLPEALKKWPVPLFREVLPRHLEIIYEIANLVVSG